MRGKKIIKIFLAAILVSIFNFNNIVTKASDNNLNLSRYLEQAVINTPSRDKDAVADTPKDDENITTSTPSEDENITTSTPGKDDGDSYDPTPEPDTGIEEKPDPGDNEKPEIDEKPDPGDIPDKEPSIDPIPDIKPGIDPEIEPDPLPDENQGTNNTEYIIYNEFTTVEDVVNQIREYIQKYNATKINGYEVNEDNIEEVARAILQESNKPTKTLDRHKAILILGVFFSSTLFIRAYKKRSK